MISIALIGVSGFAHWHYKGLLRLAKEGKARIAAATIINQDEEAAKCGVLRGMGCALYDDYRDMLNAWSGRLDLCVIPTGIHLHSRMTLAALKAGCNVLVEKPAAATVSEVDAMLAAQSKTVHFVAVGFQHIYVQEIQRMKQAICDGVIGDVRSIRCQGYWPRPDSYYTRNNWSGRLRVGEDWILDAPFNNGFAHWLNLLCFLGGSSFEKSARPRKLQAELYRARSIETADTACMRIETEASWPLLLWVTHSCLRVCADDVGPELEVRGSLGSLFWTQTGIRYCPKSGDGEYWPTKDAVLTRRDMYNAVFKKIRDADTFVCGLDIARMQTLCANAAFRSSSVNVIPPEFISEGCYEGERYIGINGIEQILSSAYDQEKLWSEMGVPWAHAGREVLLS